jgi:hypothetical protein
MVDSLPVRLNLNPDIRSCPEEWDTATGRWRRHGASLSESLKDVTSASVEVNKNLSTASYNRRLMRSAVVLFSGPGVEKYLRETPHAFD